MASSKEQLAKAIEWQKARKRAEALHDSIRRLFAIGFVVVVLLAVYLALPWLKEM